MADPPALQTGAKLGRYRVIERLGAGGMGEVWSAELVGPAGFRKPVALKVLPPGPPKGDQRDALLAEAKLGATMQHPNLVAIHALEQLDDRWVVVMERVRGPSVQDLLLGGPLSTVATLQIGLQACAGLAHLHGTRSSRSGRRWVHRDVKPSNLLLDWTGVLKVADLGIATSHGTAQPRGTAGFMAPEQLRGEPEPRSDLFSLGATLATCALGAPPLGMGPAAIRALFDLVADGDLPFLGDLDRVLPGLGMVVRRCMQAEPDDRWSSAPALAAALATLRPAASGSGLTELLRHLDPSGATRPEADLPTLLLAPTGDGDALAPTPFVGRDVLVRRVGEMLDADRIAVLWGPGGVGKTRLAIAAAQAHGPADQGPPWVFDLSHARTAGDIVQRVAQRLGVHLAEVDPGAQLAVALDQLEASHLVFDNLEQCAEAVPRTVGAWARHVRSRILCTSRVRLDLPGVPSLEVPPMSVDDAVTLFEDRSAAPVHPEERPDVRRLVQRLDGIPLAIELAAARTDVLPPSLLLDRLEPNLLRRRGGGGQAPPRHRSLTASLNWSWELLSPTARLALGQLSVFEGGFPLEAAEAVLVLPDAGAWAMDVLQELVDASWVRVDPTSRRFGLLTVVQGYALELATDRPAAEIRHGAWYAQAHPGADRDLDNLIAATRRAAERGDGRVAAACALAAWSVLEWRGPLPIARELIDAALPLAPHDRVPALAAARIDVATLTGDDDVLDVAEAALRVARAASDATGEAAVLAALAELHLNRGRVAEGRETADDAVAILGCLDPLPRTPATARTALALARLALRLQQAGQALRWVRVARDGVDGGPDALRAQVMSWLGEIHWWRGELDEALRANAEATDLLAGTGDRRGLGMHLARSGVQRALGGDLDKGRVELTRALALMRQVGDRMQQAAVLAHLGTIAQNDGRPDDARRLYSDAVDLARATHNPRHEAQILVNLGSVAMAEGRAETAGRHHRQARDAAARSGDPFVEARVALLIAEAHLDAGRPEAAERIAEAVAAAHTSGHVGTEVLAHGLAVLHAANQRDLAAARRSVAAATAAAALGDADNLHWTYMIACMRARAEAEAGPLEVARAAIDQARRIERDLGPSAYGELRHILARAEESLAEREPTQGGGPGTQEGPRS